MPPSLKTHVEDEDIHREKEDVGNGVRGIDDNAGYVFRAFFIQRKGEDMGNIEGG